MAKFGMNYVLNALLTKLHPRINPLLPKPIQVYWNITDECNYRCGMCFRWRMSFDKSEELDTATMKQTVSEIADWGVPKFGISGGEPLLRMGSIVEVAKFAVAKGLWVHVTTNGSLVDQETARELSSVGFDHISLSLDGIGKTHDTSRGHKGAYEKLVRAVECLRQASPTLIIKINCVISKLNIHQIPEIIRFAESHNASAFFQPYNPYDAELMLNMNPEEIASKVKLWIGDDFVDQLKTTINEVIEIKKQNDLLILNTYTHLDQILKYFSAPHNEGIPCVTAYKNVHISPYGDIIPCWYFENSVGNIREKTLKEIWRSPDLNDIRVRMRKCQILCLSGCRLYPKISDLILPGVKMLRSRARS